MIRLSESLELDPLAYELRRGGRTVRLERIPMEILLLLLERRPELVTREQIAERVWGPGVFVDTGNSINGAIFKLRHALRDDPENPRFIRTITGKGYRFIASPLEPTPDPTPEAPSPPLKRRGWWIVLAALVVVAAAMGVHFRRSAFPSPPLADRRQMLAVLPFENLTGDPGQDYFSDGFTEEMITRLGALDPRRLGVIARTSVMTYKQSPPPLEQLARELGVEYVLEGSVRRQGQRVRVTAQLIQLEDQTHLWARQFDRDATDVLLIQAEITRAIADEIELALGASRVSLEQSPVFSARGYEAYDHYLRGRYFWSKRTPDGFRRAAESFKKAIEANPDDARAYAGLADTYTLMGMYQYAPLEQVIPRAREAALKALEIDENLGAALTSLALINASYDLDWKTAEGRFRRAIELDPNYATAHHWYGEYLGYEERFDEAFAEFALARKLDPRSIIMAVDHAYLLHYARRYDSAIEEFRAVLAIEPRFGRAIGGIIASYTLRGRLSEALAEADRWQQFEPGPWPLACLAEIHGRLGEREKAEQELEKLEEMCRRLSMDPRGLRSFVLVGMGREEEAIAIIQQLCQEYPHAYINLKVEPRYDFLRADPRYAEILHCVQRAAGSP
jgi:TolB-like protein/DNA-binding winged helix-turn-helix (wHTH) protein/Tfp pilus assembly protein PilF